jgi:mycothiol synthase
VYLECPAAKRDWTMPPGVTLETYSAKNHADFAAAITASYAQTLDCPALNGVRSIEQVIAGHQAAGEFDPANWLLVRYHSEPAGVLLLARMPASDAMELVYIGLAPVARGHGIAARLMKLALSLAVERSCGRLTTAVDAQNKPAIQMYFNAGMEQIGSRLAMIRVIHRHQPASSTIHPQHAK